MAGIFIALGVAASPFNIPLGIAKCFPVQHAINVLSAVLLGPFYGVFTAFATSLIRVTIGTGSFLAFPGSMCGAFLSAVIYQKTKNLYAAYLGEIVGTGLIGGILAYPVAKVIMGNGNAALFGFVIPFCVSTIGGTIAGALIVTALKKTFVLGKTGG